MNDSLSNFFTQMEALQKIRDLFPDAVYIPPTRGWAGSPDYLLYLVECVILKKPKFIVELGSGVSSIVLGFALKKFSNGLLVSIDHEQEYSQKTKKLVELNNLNQFVKVLTCPLVESVHYDIVYKWYDLKNVEFENEIDILVVDGPPGKININSRYPALPVLIKKLSPNATIILDDANREDELQVILEWENLLLENRIKYKLTNYNYFEKGMCVFTISN